ncbi:hypothetical protein [Paraburkholderia phenoliruptrix]|uniref:hypothetical protein n=1 Tax=Paraburkholderia phenoliruptrix TaxID=252970 RepID=UPI001C6F1247|nr:hypothetical protein [Paraburkholderia phenoliruptrix]MBW9104200.1 hypothetical protein [Paraburkholderia phenoliruptrix]MBW9128418.1 hypothetical protein [Paraburkholderia ginsengiterrae]
MTFDWEPRFPAEYEARELPSVWIFVALYLIVEGVALCIVLSGLPKVGPVAWDRIIRGALAVPFFCWVALSSLVYWHMYDEPNRIAAHDNTARWSLITAWRRESRAGLAVLDSVILTPEPDLAERMLKLEGEPPDNPGRVMCLASIEGSDAVQRERVLIETMLAPLAPQLALVAKDQSFEVVIQCDRAEASLDFQAVWEQAGLPGTPHVRWIGNDQAPGFAEDWFKDHDRPTYYRYGITMRPQHRLLLAWHLNDGKLGDKPGVSEAAVALLFGLPALMATRQQPKVHAWLLRQIVAGADEAGKALTLLLDSEQVQRTRIRHFWFSRLKGLAQHATLGAVRESGLKVEEHALETAIGPQAPVARWVLQALAARMAHFGQGAQLVALPHERGVVLNVVAKEPDRVGVPWKKEYEYNPILGPEIILCGAAWMVCLLVAPWDLKLTVSSYLFAALMIGFLVLRHWQMKCWLRLL